MSIVTPDWILPDWDVAPRVTGFATTRLQGNLALHVGDPAIAAHNRQALADAAELPAEPFWLEQVHGNNVVIAGADHVARPHADAAYTDKPDRPLVVMVGDCLPVFIATRDGEEIGVAHAGWRGLAAGVIDALLDKFRSQDVVAWLGPAIGPCHYEVDELVRGAFSSAAGFKTGRDDSHWMADLYVIARNQLAARGVSRVFGGGFCTWCDTRFFSHRGDAVSRSGRIAAVIWKAS